MIPRDNQYQGPQAAPSGSNQPSQDRAIAIAPLPESLRRELKGQLSTFDVMLKKPRDLAPDFLTTHFTRWVDDFKKALARDGDPASLQVKYITRLQTELQDPLRHEPLDVDALLGNDGYTYNKKALFLHLSQHAEEVARYRSPMHPENPMRFEVGNHPFVCIIVQWLKEKGAFHPSAQLEHDYSKLIANKNPPPLPTKIAERIRLAREQLMAEELNKKLLEFGRALENCPFQDRLSEGLRHWLALFMRAMEQPEGVERIQKTFIALLQEELKDPLSFKIVDEDPYLGSDGETYSRKSLLVYLSNTPASYHFRSPLAPMNGIEFTVRPHPLAAMMVAWLKEKGAYHPSEEVEMAYNELVASERLPELPTEENAFIMHLKERQASLNQRAAEQLQTFQEQSLKPLMEMAKGGFDEVDRLQDANEALFDAKLKEAKRQDQEKLQQVQQMAKRLLTEAEILRAHADNLQQQIEQVDEAIAVVDRQNVQLQAEIIKTRAALKEREGRWLNDFIVFAALVAVRVAIKIAAPQLTFIPLDDGGGMLGWSKPI